MFLFHNNLLLELIMQIIHSALCLILVDLAHVLLFLDSCIKINYKAFFFFPQLFTNFRRMAKIICKLFSFLVSFLNELLSIFTIQISIIHGDLHF